MFKLPVIAYGILISSSSLLRKGPFLVLPSGRSDQDYANDCSLIGDYEPSVEPEAFDELSAMLL